MVIEPYGSPRKTKSLPPTIAVGCHLTPIPMKRRRIPWSAAGPILGLLSLAACVNAQKSLGPKPVVVARVIELEVNSGHRAVGTVRPLRTSTIGSAVDGRVQKFLVNQGDVVAAGDVLAQLRVDTLTIQKAAAEVELQLANHQLAEFENGYRAEEIAEAAANMRGAEAALKNAESNLTRIQSLVITRAASTADLEDAKGRADAARFSFKATEALLKRFKEGPREETILQARARRDLQKERLRLIEDQIDKFTIKAPFSGVIAQEFTEVGEWIDRGDPIAQVIDIHEVEIEAAVTAEFAVHLSPGDAVRVEFPELPNEVLQGAISRIVPITMTRSRTFPVQIRLSNPKKRDGELLLFAGMLARVDLPAGAKKKLPLVPKDALVLNGQNRAVFVVKETVDKTGQPRRVARKVPVSLGIAYQDRIQVQGDIKDGDRVVVVGNERLLPEANVEIVKEMDMPLTALTEGDRAYDR